MHLELRNAIPKSLQDYLWYLVCDELPWNSINDVTFANKPAEYTQRGYHYTPLKRGIPTDGYRQFGFLFPLVNELYKKEINDRDLALWRFRIGMNIPGESLYNNPHVDGKFPLKKNIVALYYVNDDDGDTFIFNETEESTSYTIKARVKPEKGKLLFFDGDHYHASSPAKSAKHRVVISLNLHERDK